MRRLKSGAAVFEVEAYKAGKYVGTAFMQTATHPGKMATPDQGVIATRAAGVSAALAGVATRPEKLRLEVA